MPQPNCQSVRYCWDAEKVKTLIRLRAELSPLFTGKRNAAKYAWAVVERELNVPLPLAKIIKKWNNLLQEYKAIKLSEEPKRRDWPFFNMMDVYFSDQVNDPTLRLFSSTKTFGSDSLEDCKFDNDIVMSNAFAAATASAAAAANLMDISDMMQDIKPAPSPDEDVSLTEKSETAANNSFNNGENSGTHQDYNDIDESKFDARQNNVTSQELLQQAEHQNIDQYLLSWNNFYGNMCRGFHSLQKDGQMVDVTIAAGGKIFKAHKLVLSVCSPYFQKIFIEHPSNHPILFMTDVNSNYMAGLLDFMYSGQVNVKYEDLPNFLKVAEAMQIKGLHSESTNENDDRATPTGHGNRNNSSKFRPQSFYYGNLSDTAQSMFQSMHPGNRSTPVTTTSPSKSVNLSAKSSPTTTTTSSAIVASSNQQQQQQQQQHSAITRTATPIPAAVNAAKYQIQQTNSTSKTMLDNQKHHKYFTKRKMATLENVQRNEKRNRIMTEDTNKNYKKQSENDTDDSSINYSQHNIKMEPDIVISTEQDIEPDDEIYYADSPTAAAAAATAGAAVGNKIKHSILESHLRQNENSALSGKLNFSRKSS